MSNKKRTGVQILQTEYRKIADLAEGFAGELTAQLGRLLADSGISMAVPIQKRVKSWSSITEKIERVGLRLKTLTEIQDVVGLRVILLFRKDVSKVIDLISGTFTILTRYNTAERLKEDQFGYSSTHLVVSMPEKWLAVPTLAAFSGLKAEIQVRTLAQHMWAETSHVLQYKREDSVPPSVRRSLYRGSALLELLDLEFDRILKERETYRTTIAIQASDAALNVDNLAKILDSMLPQESKALDEPYAELLCELQHFGIDTAEKLRKVISDHLNTAGQEDKKRIKEELGNLEQGVEPIEVGDEERLRKGLFFTHAGYLRNILSYVFGRKALTDYWDARRSSTSRNKR
jgi:putative GTP pyrophosphokinase